MKRNIQIQRQPYVKAPLIPVQRDLKKTGTGRLVATQTMAPKLKIVNLSARTSVDAQVKRIGGPRARGTALALPAVAQPDPCAGCPSNDGLSAIKDLILGAVDLVSPIACFHSFKKSKLLKTIVRSCVINFLA